VVVGLDLDVDGVVVVEGDDARVVDEDGEGPVDAFFDELEGRGGDGGLEEVVDGDRAVGVELVPRAVGPVDGVVFEIVGSVGDGGFEGLVDAVLGPGLGEGFELDGGGLAVERFVLVADGAHLVEVEEEVGVAAE
jgi:hypothetical protein